VGEEIEQIRSKVSTNDAAAWEAMQRAKQTESEVDALVRARDVPAALAKISEADSALANVEPMDTDWRTPIVERAWLGYRAARLVGSGPEYPKWIDRGLAHADRALAKAPNDPDAIEIRGTLHYLQWLTNLAPNPDAATALLTSAEQDLRATTVANAQRATAWNTLSHLLLNKGQLSEAKLAAETAYRTDPFLTNVEATILRLFLASLDLQYREEAEKWCTELRSRFPQSYRATECKLWLYALPAAEKPNMRDVWATYEEYVKVSPANVQEFDKLKGKMMVGLAYVRAGQLDSAKAIAESAQGDPQIDPRGETTNLAAIIYTQSGDKDSALELIAKWFAANPQQRGVAANDKAWWLKDLRSDPRYKALVKGSS
jgi:tetratricopeptide (TPR) repeat protein